MPHKTFKEISNFISEFSVSSFNKEDMVIKYLKYFSIEKLCFKLSEDNKDYSFSKLDRTVSEKEIKPYEPEYNDLCRLHYLILKRKTLTVLEFGSGFSTSVIAHALSILKEYFNEWAIKNTRIDEPFCVHSLEPNKNYIEITRSRLSYNCLENSKIYYCPVKLSLHDNRLVTFYDNFPNVSPDLIYIDGPSLFDTKENINGLALNYKFRMPMAADLLRFEFLLEPGTLVIVDGRTLNSRFLKSYLKREWKYYHDKDGDVSYFELIEEPLGNLNKKKIEFCLENNWLL